MLGQMQHWPLLISRIIEHAEINHGDRELFGLLPEGGEITTTYREVSKRSKQVAEAMVALGITLGDRVGTLAWNSHRHMEVWFGVSGIGAVSHTTNPRLFPEQISYIINHAEDRVLLLDLDFVPLVEKIADTLPTVEHFIILCGKEHMPETSLKNAVDYESLIAAQPGELEWPEFDENTACGLCYTSGTTGNPKGVLYSHRSNVLHTMIAISGDTLNVKATSTLMPVVPMFHANAWGMPYAAAMTGASIAFNGPHHDPQTLHKLMIDRGVTCTAAVPTVWLAMLRYLKETGLDCGKLRDVTIGGSAAPRSMIEAFENDYGVMVSHAWGMTETSPLGTLGSPNAFLAGLSREERLNYSCKQGRQPFGVELCLKDDEGNTLPRDGKSAGRLMVRGPWITSEYFRAEGGPILDDEGWFDTGDVSNIDEHGFMQITDRSKDVIKSGGEWISSIDLENAAVSHPDVTEAAVIGAKHPKWVERPLLLVTVAGGKTVSHADMTDHLQGKIAKWWMPDDTVIVEEIPHTATGKISKKDLRKQFSDYRLPTI